MEVISSDVLFVWFISNVVLIVLFNASSVDLFHECSPLLKRFNYIFFFLDMIF